MSVGDGKLPIQNMEHLTIVEDNLLTFCFRFQGAL